ncbi:MAG: prefoldin subunit alpha [Methanobacteriota archaeon]|nr:MAG: prefoldin subunit alpha [Euryarchaeota archaeon]
MPDKHSKEQEALAYRASVLDQQLKQLRVELEKVMMVLVELEKARTSVKEMKEGEDMLFQVGSGVMARGKLVDAKYLVPAGGGYYVKMSKEEADKKIGESIDRTKDYYNKINAEVKNAEKSLISLMKQARGL